MLIAPRYSASQCRSITLLPWVYKNAAKKAPAPTRPRLAALKVALAPLEEDDEAEELVDEPVLEPLPLVPEVALPEPEPVPEDLDPEALAELEAFVSVVKVTVVLEPALMMMLVALALVLEALPYT